VSLQALRLGGVSYALELKFYFRLLKPDTLIGVAIPILDDFQSVSDTADGGVSFLLGTRYLDATEESFLLLHFQSH
jgi:hypothetical protein